jgi:hypothetical protein
LSLVVSRRDNIAERYQPNDSEWTLFLDQEIPRSWSAREISNSDFVLSLSHVLSVTRTRDEFLPVRGEAGVALMMGSAGPIVLGHALVLPWIEAIVGSQLRYPYWHPRLFSISIYFDAGKDEASRAKSMRI